MRNAVLTAVLALCLTGLGLTGCGLAGSAGQTSQPPAAAPDSGGPATPSNPPSEQPSTASTPTPTPVTVKACELLKRSEAEDLADTPLGPGEESPPQNPRCAYVGPPTGPVALVEIFVGDGAKKFYDIDRELGHEFTPVPGIGDEAHAEDNTIFFRKSTTWASIRLVGPNGPAANRKPLAKAARIVADRL